MDDLDSAVVGRKERNLVGNGLSIGEGGNILANLREAQDDVLTIGTAELSLGLLSEDDEISAGVLCQQAASSLAETGVDTTTKTFIGTGDNVKSLLVSFLGLGLGGFEDGIGSCSVNTRVLHSLLGTSQTGRSDDLHGVGDLLNVTDGLETALDFTESSEVGGIGGSSATFC